MKDVQSNPEKFSGKNILFIHTGGLLGMYDKMAQLQPIIEGRGDVYRLEV